MSNTRAYAVLSIFVVGAVITPTGDALTLSLLAAPMCILYEMCIWLAYFHNKKEMEQEAQEEAEIDAYRERNQEEGDDDLAESPRFSTNEDGVPIPVPVPGRISTHDESSEDEQSDDLEIEDWDADHFSDDMLDDEDYHGEHFAEEDYDEGDEFDDGEIEDFSQEIEAIKEKLDDIVSSNAADDEYQ